MITADRVLAQSGPWSLGPGIPIAAIDVGGTTAKAGLVDASGTVIDAVVTDSPAPGPGAAEELIGIVTAIAEQFRRGHGSEAIEAISVAVPGIVDEASGVAVRSTNLQWRDVDLGAMLAAAFDVPVTLCHDVRAAGHAEFSLLDTAADAVMITIGTGVSAAVRIGDRLMTGGGYAGEIGTIPIHLPAVDGCLTLPLEEVASSSGLARRYSAASGETAAGSLEVVQARARGDRFAQQAWDDAVEALAQVCVQITAWIAPEMIVFGGGLAESATLHRDVAARLAGRYPFHDGPDVRSARLGFAAGMLGTALRTRPDGTRIRRV